MSFTTMNDLTFERARNRQVGAYKPAAAIADDDRKLGMADLGWTMMAGTGLMVAARLVNIAAHLI